jgi:hypothetical protein
MTSLMFQTDERSHGLYIRNGPTKGAQLDGDPTGGPDAADQRGRPDAQAGGGAHDARRGAVGSIDSRLKRLEESCVSCPECGLAPGERRLIAAVYPDEPGKGFQGDPYESCASCKEPLYTMLRVVRDG